MLVFDRIKAVQTYSIYSSQACESEWRIKLCKSGFWSHTLGAAPRWITEKQDLRASPFHFVFIRNTSLIPSFVLYLV